MIKAIVNRYSEVKRKRLMYDPFYWRYILNLLPSLKFSINKPNLDDKQAAILAKLNEDGIAIFPFDELFGENTLYEELKAFYTLYQNEHANEIEAQKRNRDSNKSYLHTIREKYKVLDIDNPLLKVVLNNKLAGIVDSYLGLQSHFRYCDIWQTFVAEGAPVRSQNWHRDPEDLRLVKVFIYLSDVDETAGPFFYAKGSHTKGRNFKDPAWYKEEGRNANRSSDEDVEKIIAKKDWLTATGKEGTVILADTRGLHKGGFATHKERIMYNAMFVSPSSYFKPTFTIDAKCRPNELQRRALGIK
ncbi:MAG: hypothetical protein EOP56_00765 [Sphingobacteriales bacterium]|nr:MAG: hypothetical protein EOP56_00765 [Sphingobacteriales bacterium]